MPGKLRSPTRMMSTDTRGVLTETSGTPSCPTRGKT